MIVGKWGTSTDREALASQLYTNLHTLTLAFPGQPDKCTAFFAQSLLEDPQSKPTTPPVEDSKL
ncbi:MAG: hypothetical protein V4714_19850 [Bacteroidota bacterium]